MLASIYSCRLYGGKFMPSNVNYYMPDMPVDYALYTSGNVNVRPRLTGKCSHKYATHPTSESRCDFPAGTDVRDDHCDGGADIIELGGIGSHKYYRIAYVDDISQGHGNCHRFALVRKVGEWITPIPYDERTAQ